MTTTRTRRLTPPKPKRTVSVTIKLTRRQAEAATAAAHAEDLPRATWLRTLAVRGIGAHRKREAYQRGAEKAASA